LPNIEDLRMHYEIHAGFENADLVRPESLNGKWSGAVRCFEEVTFKGLVI